MSISSIKSSLLEFYKTRDFESFKTRSLQDSQDLDDLLTVSLNYRDVKIAIIGSWICTHLIEDNREPFQKRQAEIISFLENGDHQSSLRSWMKVLTYLDVDEEFHGKVIDMCSEIIANSDNKVALQVYSIYTLVPLVLKYPELLDEIDDLIELHSMDKSVAYGAATRKFKNKTKKLRV